jgi:hypothetical protein
LRRKDARGQLRADAFWVIWCRLSTLWKTLRSFAAQWSAQPDVESGFYAYASAARLDEAVLPFR